MHCSLVKVNGEWKPWRRCDYAFRADDGIRRGKISMDDLAHDKSICSRPFHSNDIMPVVKLCPKDRHLNSRATLSRSINRRPNWYHHRLSRRRQNESSINTENPKAKRNHDEFVLMRGWWAATFHEVCPWMSASMTMYYKALEIKIFKRCMTQRCNGKCVSKW